MSLLLDTSVLIDRERAARSADVPDGDWAIAAVTLSELSLGVLVAGSSAVRARRLATYELVTDVVVHPFDEVTARTHAELVAWATEHGVRAAPFDGMIAATAVTNGLTLVTADQGMARLAGFEGLEVVVL